MQECTRKVCNLCSLQNATLTDTLPSDVVSVDFFVPMEEWSLIEISTYLALVGLDSSFQSLDHPFYDTFRIVDGKLGVGSGQSFVPIPDGAGPIMLRQSSSNQTVWQTANGLQTCVDSSNGNGCPFEDVGLCQQLGLYCTPNSASYSLETCKTIVQEWCADYPDDPGCSSEAVLEVLALGNTTSSSGGCSDTSCPTLRSLCTSTLPGGCATLRSCLENCETAECRTLCIIAADPLEHKLLNRIDMCAKYECGDCATTEDPTPTPSTELYYLLYEASSTWAESKEFCERDGGKLATIYNEEQLKTVTAKISSPVWIGLQDQDFDETWTWADGEAAPYIPWLTNEPNGGAGELCAALVSSGNYIDVPCGFTYSIVCSYTSAPRTYKLFGSPQSFDEADDFCVGDGGRLATIRTAGELHRVLFWRDAEAWQGNVWIGYTDQQQDGSFEWLDGSQTDFIPWEDTEPDGSGDCAVLDLASEEYEDFLCATSLPFLCSYLNASETSSSSGVPEANVPDTTSLQTVDVDFFTAMEHWSISAMRTYFTLIAKSGAANLQLFEHPLYQMRVFNGQLGDFVNNSFYAVPQGAGPFYISNLRSNGSVIDSYDTTVWVGNNTLLACNENSACLFSDQSTCELVDKFCVAESAGFDLVACGTIVDDYCRHTDSDEGCSDSVITALRTLAPPPEEYPSYLQLNGSNYGSFPVPESWYINSHTAEVWFNIPGVTANRRTTILSNSLEPSSAPGFWALRIKGLLNDFPGSLTFTISSDTGQSVLAYDDGEWHHAIVRVSYLVSQFWVYVDGALVIEDTFSDPPSSAYSGQNMTFGNGQKNRFNDDVKLDNIRLWSALLPVENLVPFHCVTEDTPDLLLAFDFDDGFKQELVTKKQMTFVFRPLVPKLDTDVTSCETTSSSSYIQFTNNVYGTFPVAKTWYQNSHTVELWLNVPSVTADFGSAILSNYHASQHSVPWELVMMGIQGQGTPTGALSFTLGSDSLEGFHAQDDGSWHHIVLRVSYEAQHAWLHVDEAVHVDGSLSDNLSGADLHEAMTIGNGPQPGFFNDDVRLDNLRLWSTALPLAAVSPFRCVLPTSANLYLAFSFDHFEATELLSGQNMTMVGAPNFAVPGVDCVRVTETTSANAINTALTSVSSAALDFAFSAVNKSTVCSSPLVRNSSSNACVAPESFPPGVTISSTSWFSLDPSVGSGTLFNTGNMSAIVIEFAALGTSTLGVNLTIRHAMTSTCSYKAFAGHEELRRGTVSCSSTESSFLGLSTLNEDFITRLEVNTTAGAIGIEQLVFKDLAGLCDQQLVPTNGSFFSSCSGTTTPSCVAECMSNYTGESQTYQCASTNEWLPLSQAISCKANCPRSSPVSNSILGCDGNITSGTNCSVGCLSGFGGSVSSPTVYECFDGAWVTLNELVCEDLNECVAGIANCSTSNSLCVNTLGSFFCNCTDKGFGGLECRDDINECAAGTHNCHPFAICNNTVGSFHCKCPDGYTGNGVDSCEYEVPDVVNNIGSVAASGDKEAVESATEDLLDAAANVAATDDASVLQLATSLGTLTNGSQSGLTFAAQKNIASALNVLMQARQDLIKKNAAEAANQVCGDNTCNSRYESCSSCAKDCGLCSTKAELPPANEQDLKAIGQYYPDLAKHGTGTVQMRVISKATEVDVQLELKTFESSSDVNPVSSRPEKSKFAGLFFDIDIDADRRRRRHLNNGRVRQRRALNAADGEIQTMVDLSQLHTVDPTANTLVLKLYDPQTKSWVNATCDRSDSTIVADQPLTLCDFGSYAVFAVDFDSDTAIEGVVMNSLSHLVGTSSTSSDDENDGPTKEQQAVVNNAVLDAVDAVSTVVAFSLEPGDPPVVISTPSITIQTSKEPTAALEGSTFTVGTAATPNVTLPSGVAAKISDPTVTVAFTTFHPNPYSWSNSSDIIRGGVVEFSLKDKFGLAFGVSQLDNPIDLTLASNSSVPTYQKACRFWDESIPIEGCTLPPNSKGCFGAWSTEGVSIVSDIDGLTVCQTTHLTAFAVSIDFTIEPPVVSAANFDPRRSYIVWSLFGGFYTIIALLYVFAWYERKKYDEYHEAVELGIIPLDDVNSEAAKNKKKHNVVVEWLLEFLTAMKTRHAWISSFWPTGHKVHPKRALKISALMAGISMALGLNAVFSFTASQNDGDVNTFTLNTAWGTTKIPLFGLYSFLMSFPFFLLLSVSLGRYSLLVDTLRQMAPERFRNHALAERLRAEAEEAERLGVSPKVHASIFERVNFFERISSKNGRSPAYAKNPRAGRYSEPSNLSTISETDNDQYLHVVADLEQDVNQAWEEETKMVLFDDTETSFFEDKQENGDKQENDDTGLEEEPRPQDDFEPSTLDDSVVSSSPIFSSVHDEGKKYQPEVEILLADLFKQMIFWRNMSVAMTGFLVTTGIVLCFVYIGSLNAEGQKNWIKGVGEFIVISAIITAPTFLMLFSAHDVYKRRKDKSQVDVEPKNIDAEEGQKQEDDNDDDEENKAESKDDKPKLKMPKSTVTLDKMTKGMLQVELGRALRSNFALSVV
eukprot:m.185314 g.185314  ORF g.185314 m.185314 type:complete len:2533 (+) comp25562_c0_seq5:1791-9389(+)